MKLRSSKIVITGGGSGIGKAVAKRLIDGGASVVICGRNLEKLENAKVQINSDRLAVMKWDISDIAVFDERIALATSLIGEIDGFANAAAISTAQYTKRGYEPWDITSEEWDALNNINYKAAFFMMRNEIDYMLKSNIRGNILNFASNAACTNISGSYGASKLAIIKWTRTFGKRYGSKGIIINGIAPGATFTPMISYYANNVDEPYERHAIGRFIRPEEIAELAYYLMSVFGEIICGHTVVADGGDKKTI
jgi:NAD(P)-dependent dehydrogenase (short-subunit alcohol dehydrogenase family)